MDLTPHLKKLDARFGQLVDELAKPEATSNVESYQAMRREHARLASIVEKSRRYQRLIAEEQDLLILSRSPDLELRKMADQDLAGLYERKAVMEKDLQLALLPR